MKAAIFSAPFRLSVGTQSGLSFSGRKFSVHDGRTVVVSTVFHAQVFSESFESFQIENFQKLKTSNYPHNPLVQLLSL